MNNKNNQTIDYGQYMDIDKGWIDRRIFAEQSIYEQELYQIFARCWLFLAHDSQIPKPGDFITTHMGEDNVIIVRQKDNTVKAFLNSCPHRGNKVCFADTGNARQFVCNYHGWSFDTEGSLQGMHEEFCYDEGDINKSEWGLKPVAQIDSYKGLIFATFDETAPSLEAYLGDFRWYLDRCPAR